MQKNKRLFIGGLLALSCLFTACGLQSGGGSQASSSESVSAHYHNCKKVEAMDATCLSEGNIEHWKCFSCDSLFADKQAKQPLSKEQVVTAKLAHDTEYTEAKSGNCKEPGNIEYWTCKACEKLFADDECTVEVTASSVQTDITHIMTYHAATEINGKQNGNIEYWTCSFCEGYFTDAEGATKVTKEETVLLSPVNIVDFIVEVETGRDPVVLQLSDTQIIDASQARPGREGVHWTDWASDKKNVRCYDYLREMIPTVNPDLILVAGDIVYGEFDDNGSALEEFIAVMESFKIPWAPVLGNHDPETKKGVDWQCEQFENAEYCLFEQKTLTGNGNYSVGIVQGDEVKRVFYMLDSNGVGNPSAETMANGHTIRESGFGADQIKWYTEQITALKAVSPDTKISFTFHIPFMAFADAYKQYGFTNSGTADNPINIDKLENKADGDFGYLGEDAPYLWDKSYSVYNGMKALGVDSIFVGHDHYNSASVVYQGIRFQYGQKSSEYDSFNKVMADGSIVSSRLIEGTSLVGGTVMFISEENGELKNPYIYYCGDVFGTNIHK